MNDWWSSPKFLLAATPAAETYFFMLVMFTLRLDLVTATQGRCMIVCLLLSLFFSAVTVRNAWRTLTEVDPRTASKSESSSH